MEENKVENWIKNGFNLAHQGKYREAIYYFEEILKAKEDFIEPYFEIGVCYYNLEDYPKALEYFEKAIRKDSLFIKAIYYKGLVYFALEKDKNALKCFNKIIKLNPKHYLAYSQKGAILAEDKKKFKEGIKSLDRAISINKNNTKAWQFKGYVYLIHDKYDQAKKYIDKSIELDPNDSFGFFMLGLYYLNKKNYYQALVDFEHGNEIEIRGEKDDRITEIFHKNITDTKNSILLLEKLNEIDIEFKKAFNTNKLYKLSKSIEKFFDDTGQLFSVGFSNLFPEVRNLLVAKSEVFLNFIEMLNLEEIDYKSLNRIKKVFQEWELKEYINAINSFIEVFEDIKERYSSINNIPPDRHIQIINKLKPISLIFNGLFSELIVEEKSKVDIKDLSQDIKKMSLKIDDISKILTDNNRKSEEIKKFITKLFSRVNRDVSETKIFEYGPGKHRLLLDFMINKLKTLNVIETHNPIDEASTDIIIRKDSKKWKICIQVEATSDIREIKKEKRKETFKKLVFAKIPDSTRHPDLDLFVILFCIDINNENNRKTLNHTINQLEMIDQRKFYFVKYFSPHQLVAFFEEMKN